MSIKMHTQYVSGGWGNSWDTPIENGWDRIFTEFHTVTQATQMELLYSVKNCYWGEIQTIPSTAGMYRTSSPTLRNCFDISCIFLLWESLRIWHLKQRLVINPDVIDFPQCANGSSRNTGLPVEHPVPMKGTHSAVWLTGYTNIFEWWSNPCTGGIWKLNLLCSQCACSHKLSVPCNWWLICSFNMSWIVKTFATFSMDSWPAW